MPEITYGSRYQSGLSTPEIAKLIRLDIKQAIKDKTLPQGTYSVRSAAFAGGTSITVRVRALSIPVVSVEWAVLDALDGGYSKKDMFTPEARRVLGTLEGLVAAYNYDGSDLMTDLWDVRFYSSIDFDSELVYREVDQLRQGRPLLQVA